MLRSWKEISNLISFASLDNGPYSAFYGLWFAKVIVGGRAQTGSELGNMLLCIMVYVCTCVYIYLLTYTYLLTYVYTQIYTHIFICQSLVYYEGLWCDLANPYIIIWRKSLEYLKTRCISFVYLSMPTDYLEVKTTKQCLLLVTGSIPVIK